MYCCLQLLFTCSSHRSTVTLQYGIWWPCTSSCTCSSMVVIFWFGVDHVLCLLIQPEVVPVRPALATATSRTRRNNMTSRRRRAPADLAAPESRAHRSVVAVRRSSAALVIGYDSCMFLTPEYVLPGRQSGGQPSANAGPHPEVERRGGHSPHTGQPAIAPESDGRRHGAACSRADH